MNMFKSTSVLLNGQPAKAPFVRRVKPLVNFLEPETSVVKKPIEPIFYKNRGEITKDLIIQRQLIQKYLPFISGVPGGLENATTQQVRMWVIPKSASEVETAQLQMNLIKLNSLDNTIKMADKDVSYLLEKYSAAKQQRYQSHISIENSKIQQYKYTKEINGQRVLQAPQVDEYGRAHGRALRMDAKANVFITKVKEGETPKILINSSYKSLKEYFEYIKYRENVIYPLKVVNALDKFNVYCEVENGGLKSQSEAIMFAITKALMNYNPLYEIHINKVKLLTEDRRERERKKPGQKGARARFTWVKR
jgi:ribosomal protein S9